MKYDVTKGGYILLGRCGENLARTVEIDVSEYLNEYPGAVVTLLHRRHGESGIYPVAAELRDGCLVWQPTSADTAIVGDGEAEVRVTVDGVLAKSKILSTVVDKSLTGQETDAPDPGMDWVDKITTAIDSVKNMKAEAKSVAYGEPASAEYDGKTGTMHFGIPEGRPGRDGTDGKDGAPGAKGDPGGQGPKGDPGSDANVTAENIQSALGYAPVKDVQVSGTSILTNGVANIPKTGLGKLGLVACDQPWAGGLYVNPDGIMRIAQAPPTDIDARENTTRPVIGNNLDYAVKAAMCDGKGAAWTSAEQKAARERIGAINNADITAETIQSALGYVPEKTLMSENYNGQIENLFPDKITVIVNNFWRYGNICQFVIQFNVLETITLDYGFNVAKVPFTSAMRCWLNNSTYFYIDQDGQYIRNNGDTITKGYITLSGVYITNDATASAAEASALASTDASFPVEAKVNKVKAKTDTLENTTDDIILMMADLIGGGE